MKMKPGPKAILGMLIVVALLGAGFWAGRGFPRTLDGVIHPGTVASADPAPAPSVSAERVDILENRVGTLEQEVATLRGELDNARAQAPRASAPPDGTTAPPVQPQNSSQPADPDASTSVEYR